MVRRSLLSRFLLAAAAAPVFLLLLSSVVVVHADQVLILGDSWACGEIPVMPKVLQDKGSSLTSDGYCMVSTTAANWAEHGKDAIEDGLEQNPDAKVVLVQLGGNDIVNSLASHMDVDKVKEDLKHNLETVVNYIHEKRPDLPVVINTYVYFPFDEGSQCGAWASQLMGGGNAIKMNEFNAFHRSVAAVFEHLDAPLVTVVETYHVLQNKEGKCNDDMGTPMPLFGDCIHPTEQGFYTIMEYIYDQALSKYEPNSNLRGGSSNAAAAVDATTTKEVKIVPSTCPK